MEIYVLMQDYAYEGLGEPLTFSTRELAQSYVDLYDSGWASFVCFRTNVDSNEIVEAIRMEKRRPVVVESSYTPSFIEMVKFAGPLVHLCIHTNDSFGSYVHNCKCESITDHSGANHVQ